MKATLVQLDAPISVRVLFNSPKNRHNEPLRRFSHYFVVAPVQRVVFALINQYATKISLINVSPSTPFYVALGVAIIIPSQLRALLEELDCNQALLMGATPNEIKPLTKSATIKNVRNFLAVKKLLVKNAK